MWVDRLYYFKKATPLFSHLYSFWWDVYYHFYIICLYVLPFFPHGLLVRFSFLSLLFHQVDYAGSWCVFLDPWVYNFHQVWKNAGYYFFSSFVPLHLFFSTSGTLNFTYVLVVQSPSCVWLFATPWAAAHQASLSLIISWSLPKTTASVMPSSRLIFCHPLLLLSSITLDHLKLSHFSLMLSIFKAFFLCFILNSCYCYSRSLIFSSALSSLLLILFRMFFISVTFLQKVASFYIISFSLYHVHSSSTF